MAGFDLMGRTRRSLKRGFLMIFNLGQRLGVNITPRHYESPIPYVSALPEAVWGRRSEMIGVDLRVDEQIEMVRDFAGRYRREYERFPLEDPRVPGQYYVNNGYFESVDGEMLYCFVRDFKPGKVMEIGSGNSTLLFDRAMLENSMEDPGYSGELLVIDPRPRERINHLACLGAMYKKRVQDVDIEAFEVLTSGDMLFIDSSHVLSVGSDVQYEILEIIPRLRPGVMIHLHDIFLPADYPRDWVVKDLRFLNEQYLLQAFLAFNQGFEILFAASYMHLYHPDVLEEAFKTYSRDKAWPGSLWMRRKPDGQQR